MRCNKSCIYYQVYEETNHIKNKPRVRIVCDYKDKLIKNISDTERHSCTHYKTKEDINKNWRKFNYGK